MFMAQMFSEIAPWLEMTPAGLPQACRGPAVDHLEAPNEIGLEEICLRSDQAGLSGNAKMHHGTHRQLPADSKVELILEISPRSHRISMLSVRRGSHRDFPADGTIE